MKRLLLAVMCAAAVGVLPAPAAAGDDESAIKATFNRYKAAVLAKNGKAAVAVVDAKTLAYYARMRRDALRAPKTTVKNMGLMDKLMVLSLRARFGKKLRGMTARSVFIAAVDQGMVGAGGVRRGAIGNVRVRGSQALATMLHKGRPTPMNWSFIKERGTWRLQLTPLIKLAEPALRQTIKQFKKPEDEVLIMLLKMVNKTPVTPAVWHPPR